VAVLTTTSVRRDFIRSSRHTTATPHLGVQFPQSCADRPSRSHFLTSRIRSLDRQLVSASADHRELRVPEQLNLVCSLASLGVGANATVTLSGIVIGTGTLTSSASVFALQSDNVPRTTARLQAFLFPTHPVLTSVSPASSIHRRGAPAYNHWRRRIVE